MLDRALELNSIWLALEKGPTLDQACFCSYFENDWFYTNFELTTN